MFLVGYYGFDNLGDEAIRIAIERAAERLGVDVVRYATRGPSREPRAVPVRGPGVWRYARAVLEADRVVLGGGGILKDEGLWLPAELLLTALWARLWRRPVALLGVGVGPFYRRVGRWLVAATARLASVRTVRDASSARVLASLGVGRVELGADPVFTLGAGRRAVAPPEEPESGGRRLVVSVRPWYLGEGATLEAARQRLRAAVGDAIRTARGAGWEVELVPLYWPRDRDEAQRLVGEAGVDGVEVVDRRIDWDDLAARIAGADLVVAMRYHAVLCAALNGRPTIALAYEPKVAALAADLGLTALDVSTPQALRSVGGRLTEQVAAGVNGSRFPPTASPEALEALIQRAQSAIRRALTGGRRTV